MPLNTHIQIKLKCPSLCAIMNEVYRMKFVETWIYYTQVNDNERR